MAIVITHNVRVTCVVVIGYFRCYEKRFCISVCSVADVGWPVPGLPALENAKLLPPYCQLCCHVPLFV